MAASGDIAKAKCVKPLANDMELILQIGRLNGENSDVQRKYKWVRSHQEEIHTTDARLNDRADQLATECRDYAMQDLLAMASKQTYEGSCATLKIKGTVIYKILKEAVQMALYGTDMRTYLMKKYNWTERVLDSIDWLSLEHSLRKKKGIHLVTVHKLIHLWQPTNKYVQRHKANGFLRPTCRECNDTDGQLHYMKCKSTYFTEARQHAWVAFCRGMKKYRTEGTMLRIIWIGIQN